MAADFTAAIAAWHDFYNLTGSAAFTLAGLVFVAVSIIVFRINKYNAINFI